MISTNDIEDLVNFDMLYKIAYDEREFRHIIDKFVIANQDAPSLRKLQVKMKALQKIHKFEFRRVDLVASYKALKLKNPEFYKIILKR